MKKQAFDNKLKWAFILPIVLLFISGCVAPDGGGVSGNGIVITKFEPSLAAVNSQDDLSLRVEVENRGEAIGRAAAKLMGIYAQDWGVFQTDQPLEELLPADSEAGTTGQLGVATWRLRAPDLQRGEKRTYEPMVRVFYSYETKVTKPITFVTSDELRRTIQNGESLPADPTVMSAGPITVDVRTGNFVRTTENWQQSYFPIQIDIRNTGGGLIAGEDYPVGIEIEAPQGTIFRGDCPRQSQTEWGSFYDRNLPTGLTRPISPKTVFMWNGKDTKITCELKVITPPDYREKRELKVTLKYIYYSDMKTQVQVTGTREWGYI